MTYQPYPTGGGSSNVVQQGPQAAQPTTVRTAVILMYVGAGLSAISLIGTLALSGRIKKAVGTALRNAKTSKPLTATQIHSAENIYLVFVVVVLVIAVALWVWMGWANGRGRGWARVLATVLFGLNTLLLIFSGSRTSTTLVFTGLEWLVGLAALIFLWRKDTSQYISQSQ